jgi:hypothetical protein
MSKPFFIAYRHNSDDLDIPYSDRGSSLIIGGNFDEIEEIISGKHSVYKFPFPGAVEITGRNEDGTLQELVHE